MVPRYGTMLSTPMARPRQRPNRSPTSENPAASSTPMIRPMSSWPRKNETTMPTNSRARNTTSSRTPGDRKGRCSPSFEVGSPRESRKQKR